MHGETLKFENGIQFCGALNVSHNVKFNCTCF